MMFLIITMHLIYSLECVQPVDTIIFYIKWSVIKSVFERKWNRKEMLWEYPRIIKISFTFFFNFYKRNRSTPIP